MFKHFHRNLAKFSQKLSKGIVGPGKGKKQTDIGQITGPQLPLLYNGGKTSAVQNEVDFLVLPSSSEIHNKLEAYDFMPEEYANVSC